MFKHIIVCHVLMDWQECCYNIGFAQWLWTGFFTIFYIISIGILHILLLSMLFCALYIFFGVLDNSEVDERNALCFFGSGAQMTQFQMLNKDSIMIHHHWPNFFFFFNHSYYRASCHFTHLFNYIRWFQELIDLIFSKSSVSTCGGRVCNGLCSQHG